MRKLQRMTGHVCSFPNVKIADETELRCTELNIIHPNFVFILFHFELSDFSDNSHLPVFCRTSFKASAVSNMAYGLAGLI